MFKLICVGGKLRGKEFSLEEGDNVLGRDPSCDISISEDGISKNHLRITINSDNAFLEDLGSSNGTFLNKKLIKKVSIKDGDLITIPNIIFRLVYIKEKKIIIKKQIAKAEEESDNDLDEYYKQPVPDTPLAKMLYIFKNRIMPTVYTFNKEYEWRSIIAVLLSIFILITVGLTIFPVLVDNRRLLLTEIRERGVYYTKVIAKYNARHIFRRNFDAIPPRPIEDESGVVNYELLDFEGRIIRPTSRMNEYSTDSFYVEAKENYRKTGKTLHTRSLGSGRYGVAQIIMISNQDVQQPTGIITIKFAPATMAVMAAKNSQAYLESFTTSALVGIIFFAILYYLTVKNIDDLVFQINQILKGKQKEFENKFKFNELYNLKSSINVVIQKYLDSQRDSSGGGEFDEIEDDTKYVNTLREFMEGSSGPTIILNSEKLIQGVNLEAEDLTGMRESGVSGLDLLDAARDQGFAATLIDLCDQSANNEGTCQKGSYELTGFEYDIFVTSLIGTDSFAKAFYITFRKEE